MNWYYAKNGAQQGPVALEDLKSHIAMGELAPTDLAWREGMADWLPVSSIPELKSEVAAVRHEPEPEPEPGMPAQFPAPAASAPAEPYRPPSAAPASAAPGQMVPGQVPSQGLAIGSLVCGILALIVCCLYSPANILFVLAAIVLGHKALARIKADPARYTGRGMATAGLVTGYIALVGFLIGMAVVVITGTMNPVEIQKRILHKMEDYALDHAPPEQKEELRKKIEDSRKLRGE